MPDFIFYFVVGVALCSFVKKKSVLLLFTSVLRGVVENFEFSILENNLSVVRWQTWSVIAKF